MCSDVGFISIKMAGGSCQGDCHPGRVCPVRRAPDPGNMNFLQGDLPPKRSLRKERRQKRSHMLKQREECFKKEEVGGRVS